MATRAIVPLQPRAEEVGGGDGKQKNFAGEGRSRKALNDIGNLVTGRAPEGKAQIQINRPVTSRSFGAQLLAKAQAEVGADNKKKGDAAIKGVQLVTKKAVPQAKEKGNPIKPKPNQEVIVISPDTQSHTTLVFAYFHNSKQPNMAPAIAGNQSELPSVQEIVNNGHDIPERYLNNKKVESRSGDSIPLMDAPAIDMALLASSSPSISAQERAKLQSSLNTWGCFQLVNHGMTVEFLEQVRGVSKEFFGLPLEEKLKYAKKPDGMEGYGTDKLYDEHTINWNDRLHLIVYPEHRRLLQFWPKTPVSFREVIEEFTLKTQEIVKTLLRAMAVALKLPEKKFMEMYGEEGLMFGRFNFYPRCPRAEEVLGLKPHTDGTALTVLLQDSQVEALQVQKDDDWFRVPTLPHALFINVGDQMEVMSNGVYKSAFHKVTTSGERDRVSLAMLCSPHPENEIGPAEELISEERPKMFNNVKDYGRLFLQVDPTHERPIDLLRI